MTSANSMAKFLLLQWSRDCIL